MKEDNQTVFPFANLHGKKMEGTFDGGALTSDGGAVLLREVDRRMGLIERVVGVLRDWRDPRYVVHSLTDLVRQRVFQICLGYEDADDADVLRTDPGLKAACERLPVTGVDLASQPTISRLENRVDRRALVRMAYALGDAFIASFSTPPRQVLLDVDDSTDVVHGAQQLSLFNGHVGEYTYQPLHVFDGLTGRLITTVLRPGCRAKGLQVVTILKRVVARLQQAWPEVEIIVRGDSHFSVPEVHEWCAQRGLWFILGQSPNPTLHERIAPTLARAQALFDAGMRPQPQEPAQTRTQNAAEGAGQQAQEEEPPPVRLFTAFTYQAGSWKQPLRVVAKAEVSARGTNVRFVTTNLTSSQPSFIYQQAYAGRGAMENFIKNHKTYLHSDRTSCHSFAANQFRLFLHSVAYMLLHALQESLLPDTVLEKAYFNTVQQRVLKVAARVVERATVIRIHWPSSFPLQKLFQRIDRRLHPSAAPA